MNLSNETKIFSSHKKTANCSTNTAAQKRFSTTRFCAAVFVEQFNCGIFGKHFKNVDNKIV